MTDFLRSILQTAHNANAHHSGAGAASPSAAATAVKTEVRPVDQIQVPATACVTAADATASLLAMEKQRMIKVEISEPTSAALLNTGNGAQLDAGKAQRAARRDVVNARRETKRKTMSSSSASCEDSESGDVSESSSSPSTAVVDMTTAGESNVATTEKSKKMKTGKTTSANVSSLYVEAENKPAKKTAAAAGSPSSSSTSSSMSMSCGSMLFNSEIDALGEERLRQMELQLESLDPDSKEAKKKRRLIRNRMSAQLHRERKKAYVGQLEDQLMEKERELQALQEKLNAIANESLLLQQKLSQPLPGVSAAAPVTAVEPVTPAAAAVVQIEDDVVIKTEPVVDVASAFEAVPTPTASRDSWDYCFANLEDTEMADVAADDLLRDFDHPFATYSSMGEQDQPATPMTQHHEIHAAKKNLVMVMGMMFSATFFGNSPFFFDVQSGSNFHSFFNANPPNEFSQMNMASKIMSSLEKSSWKDFRDIASWTTGAVAATTEEAQADEADDEETSTTTVVPAAASPSAASDITDSSGTCDSPAQIDDCLRLSGFETDLIDEFVYPVDDPFAPALADTNWFGDDADDFGQSDVDDNDDESEELFLSKVQLAASGEKTTNSAQADEKLKESDTQSITSRLFEKLTTLWHEKNQVLLTVVDGKNEVTSRSVADMSTIRKSMENGSIFSTPPATHAAAKTNPLANDQSVSFLYPLSAFSAAVEEKDPAASDVMFLEVSCQMSALSM